MDGIRHGTRLDQLRQLLTTTEVQAEHARRNGRPHVRHQLLIGKLQVAIAAEGGEPVPRAATAGRPGLAKADQEKADLYAALGVTPAVIRAWAIDRGLVTGTRGRLGRTVLEAYAEAHS